jgi:hypothetical protein
MADECNSLLMQGAPTRMAAGNTNARDRLARFVLALVAVLMLAWLGIMERDTRVQSRGLEAARAGDVPRALADLRSAGFLNPATSGEQVRAVLYFGQGDRPSATAILRDVVRREPDNLAGWRDLVIVARGADPVLLRRAQAEVRRLDRLDARASPPPGR